MHSEKKITPFRFLAIHHFAPPDRVVATRRLWLLHKTLAELGASVEVLTSTAGKHRPRELAYQHNFQTHFVAGKGVRDLLASPGKITFSPSAKKNPFFQALAPVSQSFPMHYWTDEGGPSYRRNAYLLASKLVKEQGITHLLSSYRPWVDHLIAERLKQKFPQLVWWADFRDLPVDPVRKDVFFPGLQKQYAKRIIQSADRVLCVSEGQAEHLRRLHPNVSVVYSGLINFPQPTAPVTEKFTINYTGSLYPKLQSVAPLGELLSAWLQTKKRNYFAVAYAGKDKAIMANWLQPFLPSYALQLDGVIDQAAARHRQQTAAVNLLLNWSAPNYFGVLTAKLYDYLAAGRPILALVNGADDPELRRIIEGSGAGRVFTVTETKEIMRWLDELFLLWQAENGKLSWQTNPQPLQALQPKRTLAKMLRQG